jgi:hypothetical protein
MTIAKGPTEWTPAQLGVIEAPAASRLIVDAGPGTGKTATLCARIAWLIDCAEIDPSEIWIISFTRTAVAEIRRRVSTYLSDPSYANGIRVATIDSHAWSMNVGFNDQAVLSGSFDDNIKQVIQTIRGNENASEYIQSVKHLFIDEAQDVVGPRIELVLELIDRMPEISGATVFCDLAQAIYEYSENVDAESLEGNLVENIRKYMPKFVDTELIDIHRTSDPSLKDLFLRGRAAINDSNLSGRSQYAHVRNIVVETCHEKVGDASNDLTSVDAEDEDLFLLFRRRGEALSASATLGNIPHRLRLSGLPPVIDDWVALVFWDWLEPRITQAEFFERWAKRVPMGGLTKADAWKRIVRIAGRSESLVEMAKLRRRLASTSPPLEVCRAEFGARGPIVGTIHAAKGREAAEVRVYLPGMESMNFDSDGLFAEEAKVLFVGASRARKRLLVGRSFMSFSSTLRSSGRAYTRCANPPWAAQVEIGREGDLSAESLVGRKAFEPLAAIRAQRLVATLRQGIHRANAIRGDKDAGYAYRVSLVSHPSEHILHLNDAVNRDLFYIARNMRRRYPPTRIPGLRTLGLRTVAVSPDDPVCSELHPPWSESGFMLAPILLGYGALTFR